MDNPSKLPAGAALKIKEDEAVKKLGILTEFNNSADARRAGIYRFKFFRLGEWIDVIIDDDIPTLNRANPSSEGEWWLPLLEKAYAKFSGSYKNMNGVSLSWALQELSGGMSVELENLKMEDEGVNAVSWFDVFNYVQNHALVCSMIKGNPGKSTNGLLHNYAYR